MINGTQINLIKAIEIPAEPGFGLKWKTLWQKSRETSTRRRKVTSRSIAFNAKRFLWSAFIANSLDSKSQFFSNHGIFDDFQWWGLSYWVGGLYGNFVKLTKFSRWKSGFRDIMTTRTMTTGQNDYETQWLKADQNEYETQWLRVTMATSRNDYGSQWLWDKMTTPKKWLQLQKKS